MHVVGSIEPVNPVDIISVEQIRAVDRIAVGDSINPDLLYAQQLSPAWIGGQGTEP